VADPQATFSESWYRIAGQRVWLRPDVIIRRQRYRGERWYVLQNPFASRYFRIRPAAYEFIARLTPERTVEEAWLQCVERFPDEAPGQEAVLRLLAQLYGANLLHYEKAADSEQLFRRYEERRQRETTARLLNIMFLRFPLLDPDRFLVRTLPVVGKLISRFGALLWLVVVGWAVKVALDNFGALKVQGQGILSPSNLALLYLALIGVKACHEFGHAYFCRKFGGEVHVMGILLMIFTPVPYVDASSSWSFRSRLQRVLVGCAGMIVELFVAALATFIWAKSGPGIVHSLCYNVMFIASVSTVIFNANPLLRFDGYYILSDLLEIPNLAQRSSGELRHLWERHVFGLRQSESQAHSTSESVWLIVYGILSGIYRVIVFGGVLLLVADRFLILGIIMAAACAVSWITVPVGKFIHYLAASPKLHRVRSRAIGTTCALAVVLLVLLVVVPFPNHFRAPGVVQARQRTDVTNNVAGRVAAILATPGARVAKGEPLVRLESPELELDLANARARRQEAADRLRQALSHTVADLKPLQSRLDSAEANLAKLEADEASLLLRAPEDGYWVAPRIEDIQGEFLARGTPLGLVIDPRKFEFVATVLQADADRVFGADSAVETPLRGVRVGADDHPLGGFGSKGGRLGEASLPARVRIAGQAGTVIDVENWSVVPGGQRELPSAALGWAGGGEVPVETNQTSQAAEPFFEVHAQLAPTSVALLHGRSGTIRFSLAPEPLLPRWWRRLRQLLQKRYQV
jgi:putative peptide zinc metalloprotease protein